ncbi:hypothetical protein DCCM_3617 [Desulfocucumis palustris]|uniref:Uncharacterized protein n=1 Tax=Desulfocucumis palustris TaxID=1898651 RepID=A0A2L2XDR2_9FIRM|nr:hypothetical protein DCCM_3617 [Desulfocucumis palustris]
MPLATITFFSNYKSWHNSTSCFYFKDLVKGLLRILFRFSNYKKPRPRSLEVFCHSLRDVAVKPSLRTQTN